MQNSDDCKHEWAQEDRARVISDGDTQVQRCQKCAAMQVITVHPVEVWGLQVEDYVKAQG